MNPETGEWRHKSHTIFKERPWLGHISYATGRMVFQRPKRVAQHGHRPVEITASPAACLAEAAAALKEAGREARRQTGACTVRILDDEAEELRWFLYPAEAAW